MVKKQGKWFTRRRFVQVAGAGVVAAVGSGVYAIGVEPNRLRVREVEVSVSGLAKEFDGMRVVQVSDVHFEVGSSEGLMEDVVGVVNGL